MRSRLTLVTAAAGLLLTVAAADAADCPAPRTVATTSVGMRYCVDPAFDAVVAAQLGAIRADVRAQRQAGKLVIYASTPISPRGGGHEKTNIAIGAAVKARLEKELGAAVWVLDPGRYQLAAVNGRAPGGEEYMVMWTAALAGADGQGADFDVMHFTGPGDMRAFFGCGREDVTGCAERYLTARAAADPELQRIAGDPARRRAFVRFYALRASSAFSKGAHDEWNIAVRINRRRPLGEQLAVWFDGRPASPAEMEVEVSPGYEFR
ncbi:MAG: hypothetical protein HY294_09865 [Candidatus Rokubacteria bacterium]|nr:hypothetical protein [Candidatus Rokubacteria bacterium]MBI3826290.1 hypothetical protein [Candidatus Rokubacteria bacterium]